ncbi:MAG: hypothetical protein LBV51_00200 [Acholeplasmatales bacterium]|nr:hypothetical protein [Acholeplasmatales bacterium]
MKLKKASLICVELNFEVDETIGWIADDSLELEKNWVFYDCSYKVTIGKCVDRLYIYENGLETFMFESDYYNWEINN